VRWIVEPEDPTANILEIWYDVGAELEVTLTTPAGKPLAPVALGMGPLEVTAKDSAGKDVVLGIVDHQKSAPWIGLNRVAIILGPTGPTDGSIATPLAPAGTWQVRLRNVGTVGTRFDAWIERDTSGRAGGARRMQSRFHPDDAEPLCTLSSYATGKLTLAVGGYNTATGQVARYSACGPTRDGEAKPEVLAPAEEDAEGRGILCASSRSATPARMNGTSAAAPVVAGLVALLFEARAAAVPPLDAKKIRRLIIDGASAAQPTTAPLRPNAHIGADDRRRFKQDHPAIWPHLVGSGRINWPATRDQP
jgi:subtilisin family serine protease